MRKRLGRLAVIVGLITGAFTIVPVQSALAATCPNGQGFFRVAENQYGGGDTHVFCHPATSSAIGTWVDLGNVAHTEAGICYATFKAADNWEDCISSVNTWFPAPDGTVVTYEWCGVLYQDPPPNGGTALWYGDYKDWDGWFSFSGSTNDVASAIRWGRLSGTGGAGSTCIFTK